MLGFNRKAAKVSGSAAAMEVRRGCKWGWEEAKTDHHMGRERVFSEKKSPITSVKLFGIGKVSGITKKNFKIGTLGDFEKSYVLYVAMAEKPLSSGQKWFLR